MISPPTDRLHKFLAIAGISLILFGVSCPLTKYSEAQLEQINMTEKMDETKYAYLRFAQIVKEVTSSMGRFYKGGSCGVGGLKNDFSKEEFRKAYKSFLAKESEVRKLEKEMYDTFIQYKKHSKLVEHYEHMKNVWFSIGALSVVIGIILSFIGFRQWFAQPKSSR